MNQKPRWKYWDLKDGECGRKAKILCLTIPCKLFNPVLGGGEAKKVHLYFINLFFKFIFIFHFLCKQMQSSLDYLFYFFLLVPSFAFALFLPIFKLPLIFIVTDQLSRDKVKVKYLMEVTMDFFSSFCFRYWSLQAGCENDQFSLTLALRRSLSKICNLNCAPLIADFSIDDLLQV